MNKIKELFRNQTFLTLALLFILAFALRFLYFPENIYFGYDQARDAFISQEVLHGKIKIVGPTTSIPGLSHGPFFYYLFAPIYLMSGFDPTGLSIFLRTYNALGLFLIFLIAKNLFKSKWIGLISALLYAFSYEQTQYALFMTHPALAVLTVLTFYLGLSYLFFNKKAYGLPIAVLGLGLSFQFHFLLAYLFLIFVISLIIFRKRLPKLSFKIISLSVLILLFTLSTFIVAEIKFGFGGTNSFISSVSSYSKPSETSPRGGFEGAYLQSSRFVQDNLLAFPVLTPLLLLILFALCVYYLRQKEYRDQFLFLMIWFMIGLFSYFVSKISLYFYGVGTSLSLLLVTAFLISKLYQKLKIAAVVLVVIILLSNLYLVIKNNKMGPNEQINVQVGMLLHNEKRVIDYIYSTAGGQPFAVNAFSMPLYVNTTWAYLFESYGKKKYGYLPVWGGNSAPGYEGNLTVNNSRSTLPERRFLILEPNRGFEQTAASFLENEGWFTDIIEEQRFGEFIVDYQKPK
jgi:4-amino-4-deoxy-L-arabinose transferase-like glycosyltransferase